MWRSDKTKEEGFRLLEVADDEKLNTCVKVINIRAILVKIVMCSFCALGC